MILDCTHVSGLDFTTVQGIIELEADFLRNDVTFALACVPVSLVFCCIKQIVHSTADSRFLEH